MILQSLYDYYQRKTDLPREGFEWKEIPFVIEVNTSGSVVQIEDTRKQEGNKKRGKPYYIPQRVKKTRNVVANLLWGNAEYVLGLPNSKKLSETKSKAKETEYRKNLKDKREAFIRKIKSLPPPCQADEGVRAVVRFCEHNDYTALERFTEWKEVQTSNQNITFRLQGDIELICQRQAVTDAVSKSATTATPDGVCLITGDTDEIERLHAPIKGVMGAPKAGADIISFNRPAFKSWGKKQGRNAPVGKRSAFSYTTALNYLLGKDSRQHLQVGDASTVFWADKPSPLEDQLPDIFEDDPVDDPDRGALAIRALYKAPHQGIAPINDDQTRFFVLGLVPNAARIAIRFWHVGTVAELAKSIQQHFDDLEIVRSRREKPHLSVLRLLRAVAVQGQRKNIPPNLSGEVMRSIMGRLPYPDTLMQGAIRRVRAEREVTYPRAAIIKACLNRRASIAQTSEKEITVSLDHSNMNPGYRLGRLFAVLEKIQEEAGLDITATLRERFYGAASSTPVTVLSNLMKLKNHHLAKLENRGRRVNLERLISEIMDGVDDFPSHLNLADQGRFNIGYYHQRHALFTKSTETKQGD
ncbi:MAG: type I-C CRISPR-associated protein Cas8c/Csd1 [Deltaproteobacteria bacterium]|nr:type I-C CRISPR-associated protein Cas8c/Csd1 [Deltaproteobacteria bacterium]